jgi:hypothetical protein
MESIRNSMDIMDSMWNDDGMVMESLIPYGIHMDSMEQFHMDSMEIPWNKAPFPWETTLSKIM